MQSTTNYGLNKPDEADFYDINVQNKNMDKIDEELGKHQSQLGALSNSLRTYTKQINNGQKFKVRAGNLQPYNGFIATYPVGPSGELDTVGAFVPVFSSYPYIIGHFNNFVKIVNNGYGNGTYATIEALQSTMFVLVASDSTSGIMFEEVTA